MPDAAMLPPPLNGSEFFHVDAAFSGLGAPIPGGSVMRWLLTEGPRIENEIELVDELCWRLVGDGLPIWRASLHGGTLHPQTRGFGLRWLRDRNLTEHYRILHGSEQTDEYRLSPIRRSIEEGIPFRRRLTEESLDYPLLNRIRAAGGTDYVALPLNRNLRYFPVVTWTSDRPDGFTAADLAALEELNPAIAAIVDTRIARHIGTNLLDTYLGHQAGERVLAGAIRRGQGERMRAVIMIADLRNFTGLSDRLPGDAVIALLDDFFDAIASTVHDRNGEILKFVGDGVLAIFPAEADEDFAPASLRGLEAAKNSLARLEATNRRRHEQGVVELRAGFGLHLGEVIYGNVGAADRLDFTVIGPAVNLASRIEGLTKRLLRPLVTSHDFARVCPLPLVSLGFHPVRGLNHAEEVFGLPD